MKKKLIIVYILIIVFAVLGYMGYDYYIDKNNNILQENTEADILSNDKLNIYFFWGKGCPHCEELSKLFYKIRHKYGKYYNLYTFEVWNNTDNSALMDKFGVKLNVSTSTVPFLVIGDKVIMGYNSSKDDDIINTIKEQLNKEHIDIYKELDN